MTIPPAMISDKKERRNAPVLSFVSKRLWLGAVVLQKGAATRDQHLFCVLYCPKVRESKAS
jgi:hypothetical protein